MIFRILFFSFTPNSVSYSTLREKENVPANCVNRWLESRSLRRISSEGRMSFSENIDLSFGIRCFFSSFFFVFIFQLNLGAKGRHWAGEMGRGHVSEKWAVWIYVESALDNDWIHPSSDGAGTLLIYSNTAEREFQKIFLLQGESFATAAMTAMPVQKIIYRWSNCLFSCNLGNLSCLKKERRILLNRYLIDFVF